MYVSLEEREDGFRIRIVAMIILTSQRGKLWYSDLNRPSSLEVDGTGFEYTFF